MHTIIKFKAKDYFSCENLEVGVLPYGSEVIHNAKPYGDRVNSATYRIRLPRAGRFILFAEYAAAAQRPVCITFNELVMTQNGLCNSTGGWEEKFQRWEEQIPVYTNGEWNVLKIRSEHVFPHIRTFLLADEASYLQEGRDEIIRSCAYAEAEFVETKRD